MGELFSRAEAIPSEPVMQSRKTEVSRSHSTDERHGNMMEGRAESLEQESSA